MTAEDEIAFLETFRDTIERYLVVGTAPTQDPIWGGSGLLRMKEAMRDPAFRALRRDINRMKGRAAHILERLGIGCTFEQYPPPAVGGPVVKFPLFDLITDNQSLHTIDGSVFTDKIDEALGLLQDEADGSSNRLGGMLLVLCPEQMQGNGDIPAAIADSTIAAGLTARRLNAEEDFPGALTDTAIIVADISDGDPKTCWRAGYAHGLGKMVIYLCRVGEEPAIAVSNDDTIRFNCPDDLTRALSERLADLSKGLL